MGYVTTGFDILNPAVQCLLQAGVRDRRSEFLLLVALLPVRGTTGSAVNPIVVF